jgi:hypothetical protein
MIRRLVRKIGIALLALGNDGKRAVRDIEPGLPDLQEEVRRSLEREEFDRRAEQLVAGRSDPEAPLAASAVQLLGMQDIRAELGEAWDEVAAKAYAVSDEVIRRNLGPSDIFARRDEETYILCFAGLGRGEAEHRTRDIVAEIKAALLREVPQARGLRVDHRGTDFSPHLALSAGSSLLDAIAASLDNVSREVEDTVQRQRRMLLDRASAVFCPVWATTRQTVALHRCRLDDWTSKSTLQNLQALTDPDSLQQAIADLDFLLLGRAIEMLHSVMQANGKTILLVPVHYQTLAQRAHREEFLSLCQRVPSAYRRYLLFEIYGVPAQAPNTRLLQLAKILQPFCHGAIVSLPPSALHRLFEIGTSGIYGIAATQEDIGSVAAGVMAKYVAAAKAGGLRTFLHGARTIGMVKKALDAGFDYVDGEAVAPKTAHPRAAYPLKLHLMQSE